MKTDKKEIYCNCCGNIIHVAPMGEREDFLSVTKEWGYFSGKDLEIHQFDICETCYDQWIERFRIPVTRKEQTELL